MKTKKEVIVKHFVLSAVAAAVGLIACASTAFAAPTVDATVDLSGISQVTKSITVQDATAISVGFGGLNFSTETSAATNALDVATQGVTVDEEGVLGNGPTLNLTGALVDISQMVKAPTLQTAFAISGSGGLNESTLSSQATNVVDDAGVTVNITNKH